jgi:hypothetical protein
MTPESVRDYAQAIRPRYLRAPRLEKGRILQEFCLTTGYHRKAAVRLLGRNCAAARPRPGRPVRYGSEVAQALKAVWEASDHLCSKRLEPFQATLLEALERHGELRLAPELRSQLLQMSPATIDRLLKPAREHGFRRPYIPSRSSVGLKALIPIRTFADWDNVRVGYLEADLVAHCGESTEGFYVHTLDMIDIVTGWTELAAVWGKQQERVGSGVDEVRRRLPFGLLGLDCDNGSEFINQGLFDYCRRHKVVFTRSRPYRKNDQAHVEQRNWFTIRRMVGYDRYSSKAAYDQMVKLYALIQDYMNFFQPMRKLVSKERVAGKVRKRYDEAQTPYQRLLASKVLPEDKVESLRRRYEWLNPVRLRAEIEAELEKLWNLREQTKVGESNEPPAGKVGQVTGR